MATDLGKVGMRARGDWSNSATYEVLDVVSYNNGLYIAKQAVPANTDPTNTTYWQVALDGTTVNKTIYVPLDECSTIPEIFIAINPTGVKTDLKSNIIGEGSVGNFGSDTLKALLGNPSIGNYVYCEVRPVVIAFGSCCLAEVLAVSLDNSQKNCKRKYIWMNRENASQSAWETISYTA